MRLWWHKLTHWEYWPVYVVYMPTFFLWLFYAVKYRMFHFYRFANPGIANGGLYWDSKMDIYEKLPDGTYPKTVLIHEGNRDELLQKMESSELSYPIIVKPDMGQRGVGVAKVYDHNELLAYAGSTEKDFLLQEVIDYTNEIGLFYYRMPNQVNGILSGITTKAFLTVVGDGSSTIESLLKKKERYELQINTLSKQYNLEEILPQGEERCLVPFGNHNRGTAFFDGEYHITDKLVNTFDSLLSKVDGFYYGRLDIRFNTFEELERGENFSIIEVNGVKSEPTHIYDPKHSFFHGQMEIYRHQSMMGKIAQFNIQKHRATGSIPSIELGVRLHR